MANLYRKSRKGDAMDDFLFSLGLIRKPIPKDHSSLFRIVSDQVYMTQRYFEEIKSACLEYLLRNNPQIAVLLSDPEAELNLHHQFQENGQLLEAILNGLSLLYNRDFVAYREVNKPPVLLTSGLRSETIVLVESFGHHFDSVYQRTSNYKAAICQSIVYNILYRHVLGMNDEVDLALGMLRTRSTERRRVVSLSNEKTTGVTSSRLTMSSHSASSGGGSVAHPSGTSSGVFTRMLSSGYDPSLRGSTSDFESSAEYSGISISGQVRITGSCQNAGYGGGGSSLGYYGSFPQSVELAPMSPCLNIPISANPLLSRSVSIGVMSINSTSRSPPLLVQSGFATAGSRSPNQMTICAGDALGGRFLAELDKMPSFVHPVSSSAANGIYVAGESPVTKLPQFPGPPFPFRVAKSLDPVIYRNVEYDVWLESRRQNYFANLALSAKCKFHPGATCLVTLPDASLLDAKLVDNRSRAGSSNQVDVHGSKPTRQYHAIVQEIDYANQGPVVVFVHELGEKRSVPMASLTEFPVPIRPSRCEHEVRDIGANSNNCDFNKSLHELGDLDEFPIDFPAHHEESCFSPEDYLNGLAWFGAGLNSPPYYASPPIATESLRVDGNDLSSNSYSSSPECHSFLVGPNHKDGGLLGRLPAKFSKSSNGLFQFDHGSGDSAEDNAAGAHPRFAGSCQGSSFSDLPLGHPGIVSAAGNKSPRSTFQTDRECSNKPLGKFGDEVSRMSNIGDENFEQPCMPIRENQCSSFLNDSDWPTLPLDQGPSSNGSSGSPPRQSGTPRQVPPAPRKVFPGYRNRKMYRQKPKFEHNCSTESSSQNGYHGSELGAQVRRKLDFSLPAVSAAEVAPKSHFIYQARFQPERRDVPPFHPSTTIAQHGTSEEAHGAANDMRYGSNQLERESGSSSYLKQYSEPRVYSAHGDRPDVSASDYFANLGQKEISQPSTIQTPREMRQYDVASCALCVNTNLPEAIGLPLPTPSALAATPALAPASSPGRPATPAQVGPAPQTLIMPFFPVIQAAYFDQSYINDGRINMSLSPSQDVNGIDLPFSDLTSLRYFFNLGVEYFRQFSQFQVQHYGSTSPSSAPPLIPFVRCFSPQVPYSYYGVGPLAPYPAYGGIQSNDSLGSPNNECCAGYYGGSSGVDGSTSGFLSPSFSDGHNCLPISSASSNQNQGYPCFVPASTGITDIRYSNSGVGGGNFGNFNPSPGMSHGGVCNNSAISLSTPPQTLAGSMGLDGSRQPNVCAVIPQNMFHSDSSIPRDPILMEGNLPVGSDSQRPNRSVPFGP